MGPLRNLSNIVRGTGGIFFGILMAESNKKGCGNMYLEFVYTLFYDEQAARPADFCRECGCERYAPGLHCLRCERRGK